MPGIDPGPSWVIHLQGKRPTAILSFRSLKIVYRCYQPYHYWWGYKEKETLYAVARGMWILAASKENSVGCPQKLKSGTIIWSSNLTSGYLSDGKRSRRGNKCIAFLIALVTIVKAQKQPKCLQMTEGDIWYTCVCFICKYVNICYDGILFSH